MLVQASSLPLVVVSSTNQIPSAWASVMWYNMLCTSEPRVTICLAAVWVHAFNVSCTDTIHSAFSSSCQSQLFSIKSHLDHHGHFTSVQVSELESSCICSAEPVAVRQPSSAHLEAAVASTELAVFVCWPAGAGRTPALNAERKVCGWEFEPFFHLTKWWHFPVVAR